MRPTLMQRFRETGTFLGYRVVKIDHGLEQVVLAGPGRRDARKKMTWDTLWRKYEHWPSSRMV